MNPLLLSLSLLIVVVAFLVFLGVYADMAKRTRVPTSTRMGLLLTPIVFTIVILATFLPIFTLFIYPLFLIDMELAVSLMVPSLVGAILLMILVGAGPIWLINRKYVGAKKSMLLSSRLLLVPLIDAFWSTVSVFVATTLATPVIFIASLITLFGLSRQGDWTSMIQYALSPDFSLAFALIFPLFGLFFAYFLLKMGPSEVLAKYYHYAAMAALAASFLAALLLFLYLGPWSLLLGIVLVFAGLIVSIVYSIVGALIKALRIAGVFGLALILFSLLMIFMVLEAGRLHSLPVIGEMLYSLVPRFSWMVVMEIGLIGLVLGGLIMVLARRQQETGQVMTRAMAVTVLASSFLPLLLFLGILTPPFLFPSLGIVTTVVGLFLLFLSIAPLYLLTVNFLRIWMAIRSLLEPMERSTV